MTIPLELGRQAIAQKLDFLLGGGHAVVVHGYQRTTFDLDLIVSRDDKERWLRFMADAGYQLLREGSAFIQFTSMDPEKTPVDLLLTGAETFAKMVAEAVPAGFHGLELRAVSLQHLVALKCHAIRFGHSGRIVKDADDVIHLLQVNRVDVSLPEWRELIQKYGTEELYEKLRRVNRAEY